MEPVALLRGGVTMAQALEPAIFLDRDGVIIENRADYVRAWGDVAFLPGALAALAGARRLPYRIVIVTNQSAVGRGILSLAAAQALNQRILAAIEQAGGRVDGLFMCPHAPWEGCACRKPAPGLLLQAAGALGLDLPGSLLIGDALSDLQAGLAAGVKRVALVRSGRGAAQAQLSEAAALGDFPVFADLAEALAALPG